MTAASSGGSPATELATEGACRPAMARNRPSMATLLTSISTPSGGESCGSDTLGGGSGWAGSKGFGEVGLRAMTKCGLRLASPADDRLPRAWAAEKRLISRGLTPPQADILQISTRRLRGVTSPSVTSGQVENMLQIADGESGHAAVVADLSAIGQIVDRPRRTVIEKLVNVVGGLVIDVELIVRLGGEGHHSPKIGIRWRPNRSGQVNTSPLSSFIGVLVNVSIVGYAVHFALT